MGDAFKSAEFIPSKTLKRLELRRGTIKKTSLKLETKLAEAELRRKELEEEKVKTVLERHGRMRSASAMRREQQYSATVAKRQAQLQEMRDKLKEKHKKNDMIKLKKQLQFGASPNSSARFDSGFNMQGLTAGGQRDFFDD